MGRLIDVLGIALLLAAGGAFSAGVHALGESRDLVALYWLALGGLLLKGTTDLMRPSSR
jgi:hypothetical protein